MDKITRHCVSNALKLINQCETQVAIDSALPQHLLFGEDELMESCPNEGSNYGQDVEDGTQDEAEDPLYNLIVNKFKLLPHIYDIFKSE